MSISHKESPLICLDYHLISVNLVRNPDFSPQNPVGIEFSDLKIFASQTAFPEGTWKVNLKLQQHPGPSKNPPYVFTIEIEGYFKVGVFPEDKKGALVGINGSSILFTAAREILLSLTAKGPNPTINLPTVAFKYEADAPVVSAHLPTAPANISVQSVNEANGKPQGRN